MGRPPVYWQVTDAHPDTIMDDILAARRSKSDLCWAMKSYNQDTSDFTAKLLPTSLLDCVKTDAEVMTVLAQLSPTEQRQARQKIDDVFTEMHHSFGVGSVRRVGFCLAKIFKQLYDHIHVERAGIEQVRSLPGGIPTLYLPTHRSYVDFLLVSYICFHYHLPLPVIAAGMDFKSMLCVGDILRNCGAFFIRRRLNGDRLYAAVLRAYVRALALTNPQPAEFFIEGTRSRSGKPLPPRTGLLSAYLELFHSGQIPDLHIVPISISYERVLEENLYAYEMLGTPKPPESTGRLVGAVSVLAENYGSVRVRLLGIHSLRTTGSPGPGLSSCRLAADVLRRQLAGGRLPASCLLLAALQLAGGSQQLLQLVQLAGFIGRRLAAARPLLSVEEVCDGSVSRAFHVHHSLLRLSSGRQVELRPPGRPASTLHRPADGPRLKTETVTAAVPRIQLQFYVNPLLPHIVGAALSHIASSSDVSDGAASRRTLFELMSVEFPTLQRWDAEPQPPSADTRWQEVQVQLIRPYLEAYRGIIAAILAALPEAVTPAQVQLWAEQNVELGRPWGHLCLCRDVISNCSAALVRMAAGTRENGNGNGNGGGNGNGNGRGPVQWHRQRLEAVAAVLDSVCHSEGPPTVKARL